VSKILTKLACGERCHDTANLIAALHGYQSTGASTSKCVASSILLYGNCPVYLTNTVRTVTAACSPSRLRSTNLLSFSYGRDSVSVPSHTLGFQRGTLCLQVQRDSCCRGHESFQRQAVKTHYFSLAFG